MAELLDSRSFSGVYLAGLVLDNQRLLLNARRDYIYNQELAPELRDLSDHLMIYDMSSLKLDRKYARPTGTTGVQLMGTYRGRLFMKLGGDGIIVVDATDPARPIGRQFLRTLGWATHIEFAGLKAYVASGNFGISHIDLSENVVIPTS
jgi:hypothetical protein